MNVGEHCLIVLYTLSLFHVNICIHAHEYHQENLINQGIVGLECITLIAEMDSFQAFLSQFKFDFALTIEALVIICLSRFRKSKYPVGICATLMWCQTMEANGVPLIPLMSLRCNVLLNVAQLFLSTLSALRSSVFFCSSSH